MEPVISIPKRKRTLSHSSLSQCDEGGTFRSNVWLDDDEIVEDAFVGLFELNYIPEFKNAKVEADYRRYLLARNTTLIYFCFRISLLAFFGGLIVDLVFFRWIGMAIWASYIVLFIFWRKVYSLHKVRDVYFFHSMFGVFFGLSDFGFRNILIHHIDENLVLHRTGFEMGLWAVLIVLLSSCAFKMVIRHGGLIAIIYYALFFCDVHIYEICHLVCNTETSNNNKMIIVFFVFCVIIMCLRFSDLNDRKLFIIHRRILIEKDIAKRRLTELDYILRGELDVDDDTKVWLTNVYKIHDNSASTDIISKGRASVQGITSAEHTHRSSSASVKSARSRSRSRSASHREEPATTTTTTTTTPTPLHVISAPLIPSPSKPNTPIVNTNHTNTTTSAYKTPKTAFDHHATTPNLSTPFASEKSGGDGDGGVSLAERKKILFQKTQPPPLYSRDDPFGDDADETERLLNARSLHDVSRGNVVCDVGERGRGERRVVVEGAMVLSTEEVPCEEHANPSLFFQKEDEEEGEGDRRRASERESGREGREADERDGEEPSLHPPTQESRQPHVFTGTPAAVRRNRTPPPLAQLAARAEEQGKAHSMVPQTSSHAHSHNANSGPYDTIISSSSRSFQIHTDSSHVISPSSDLSLNSPSYLLSDDDASDEDLSSSFSTLISSPNFRRILRGLSHSTRDRIHQQIGLLWGGNFLYDTLRVDELSEGRSLVITTVALGEIMGLPFPPRFLSFVKRLQSNYSNFQYSIDHFSHKPLFHPLLDPLYDERAYHTHIHAADVAASFFCIIRSNSYLFTSLTSVEKLGVLLAAIIHDYNHPGHSNAFETAMGSDLAILFSDQSVLVWKGGERREGGGGGGI